MEGRINNQKTQGKYIKTEDKGRSKEIRNTTQEVRKL